MVQGVIELVVLAGAAFVQNMAFTWVSRSRNSGDPSYHRWAALASNSIWFVVNILVVRKVWAAIERDEWWWLAASFVVYVLATSEGSVTMMRVLLKREKGSRRVGAYGDKPAPPESRELKEGTCRARK